MAFRHSSTKSISGFDATITVQFMAVNLVMEFNAAMIVYELSILALLVIFNQLSSLHILSNVQVCQMYH